jgi:carboxymethylenebutenolidase
MIRRAAPWLLALVAAALLTAPAAAQGPKVKVSNDWFESGGEMIRVRWYETKGKGKRPLVILLHDATGFKPKGAQQFLYGECCKILAREGYKVLLVRFFDRTGHEELDPQNPNKDGKHFAAWRDTVRDAVLFARMQPDADPERIGILGFSLGGYLGVAVAAQPELKVAALVEFFGGLHEEIHKTLKHLPVTLIIHGKKDTVVPVKHAHEFKKAMDDRKLKCEIEIYDVEHLFKGEPWWGRDIQAAQKRTLAFFAKHLQLSEQVGQAK